MKKFYLSIVSILLPAIVYTVFFTANDPHNYWGRTKYSESDETLIGKLLEYKHNGYEGILLGDSRIAHSTFPDIDSALGAKYLNMSFGGCMATEMNTLFWWCEEKGKSLKDVTIVTSLYNMNTLLQQDRVSTTIPITENYLSYAFNYNVSSDMFEGLKKKEPSRVKSEDLSMEERDARFKDEADGMDYYLSGFKLDLKAIGDLCDICDYCAANGINIKVILPPWYVEYYDLLDEYGLSGLLDEYKSKISQHAMVIDMEYKDCELSQEYLDYIDHTHFQGETFEKFQLAIYGDYQDYMRIWRNGEVEKGK